MDILGWRDAIADSVRDSQLRESMGNAVWALHSLAARDAADVAEWERPSPDDQVCLFSDSPLAGDGFEAQICGARAHRCDHDKDGDHCGCDEQEDAGRPVIPEEKSDEKSDKDRGETAPGIGEADGARADPGRIWRPATYVRKIRSYILSEAAEDRQYCSFRRRAGIADAWQ